VVIAPWVSRAWKVGRCRGPGGRYSAGSTTSPNLPEAQLTGSSPGEGDSARAEVRLVNHPLGSRVLEKGKSIDGGHHDRREAAPPRERSRNWQSAVSGAPREVANPSASSEPLTVVWSALVAMVGIVLLLAFGRTHAPARAQHRERGPSVGRSRSCRGRGEVLRVVRGEDPPVGVSRWRLGSGSSDPRRRSPVSLCEL